VLFNSVHFFIFFPVVVALYFCSPERLRRGLLLLAGCYFYMAFVPAYILVLFFIIGLDYVAAFAIDSASGQRRKLFLAVSLTANLCFLGIFKYYNFFNDNLKALAEFWSISYDSPELGILLPLGLSFHTFQSMAYTIEVYRGRFKPERNLVTYALYVLFFPQLVAGPIERPQHLLPQLKEHHRFEPERVARGLRLMLWGFFKKIVIADRLAVYVNIVYESPQDYLGIPLMVATFFFAFQIYCDFSGYSDIATGIAEVLGMRFVVNFRRPYFATSVADLWRRWHISLSTWFRDYVFIPLGGNRVTPGRWYLNLFITLVLSGFWHGAAWNFLVWGALHGLYLVVGVFLGRLGWPTRLVPTWLGRLSTFVLTCLAWAFFRAQGTTDAAYVLLNMWVPTPESLDITLGLGFDYFLSFLLIAILLGVEWREESTGRTIERQVAGCSGLERGVVYLTGILVIVFLGKFSNLEFIYFQF